VRLQAKDKAGNTSEPKSIILQVNSTVAGMPPQPDPSGPSNIMHVSSRTFRLEYALDNVGPSQVASVDVWKMRPGGDWTKCDTVGDGSKTAVNIKVESSGRWGFRLIPRNGVGLAQPNPQRGDPPDVWVEVDDQHPLVRITSVTVNPDGGFLTVNWKANDTFLKATPITISVQTDPQGGWKSIVSDLPNSGSWSCKTDELQNRLDGRFEFSLKVTAMDEAGNVGENIWREKVKIDLQIPRAIKIKVAPNSSTPPGSSSTSATDGLQSRAIPGPASPLSVTPLPPAQPTSNPPLPPSGSTGQNWNQLGTNK